MLLEEQLHTFILSNYTEDILEQAENQRKQKSHLSFQISLDLLDVMKSNSKIVSTIIGNYSFFVQTF